LGEQYNFITKMAFFQNSVLEKHLKAQDTKAIKLAYEQFRLYFHNSEIQENIRNSKEEQFQEGFLRELFVKILGYTLNPNPNFNLTTELKNEKDNKKADGAILINKGINPLVIGVIELKGTDTKDLEKINQQAFNYKNNQTSCVYVITSNFEKLRFYIHHSVENLEFNLFTLTETEFQLLWLCLSAENLFKGIPLKVKEESLLVEENVTKKLYKDYATFRQDLWQNMVKNNAESDKLLLFKKTQKLLDRFLFIFFAEDSGLLPTNSISRIIKRYETLKNEDAYKPLYEIFKQYFSYIDKGRKGQNTDEDIFAYNGGLFTPDEVLDTITIEDKVLYKHVKNLTIYDFASEVDVNILGHIFENSLNEIENITASLSTIELIPLSENVSVSTRGLIPLSNSQTSKRKKDGVFYTPKYITKYIVENTVGKLCEEKKTEFSIIDEDYAKGRRNRKKETIIKLDENLKAYRNWLLNITICDPACGSGAFLNQALEFLINEHAYIDELQAQLFGGSLVFQDVSNHILENNIFGVDINDESVDIAKLSLWLRTAQRGRKLTSLNNNIKCGNSLIDDKSVAGDKAFNWQTEFPTVFKEKEKKAFHVTTATHDSRTSERMIEFNVREKRDNGLRPQAQPIWLDAEDEILITKTISEIVIEDKLNVLAYNICGDHIHLLLICEETEVSKIVGKIKGKTSRIYNSNKGINPIVQKGEEKSVSLWTQKFGCNEINDDKQLYNTIEYIRNNRTKHEFPINKGINPLVKEIEKMICTFDHAFRTEYNGGFDVVIGNPPYVNINTLPEIHNYLKDFYSEIHTGYNDLMYYFIYKGIDILKQEGIYGIITSNYFIGNDYASKLRLFLNKHIELIVNFEKTLIFSDANVHTTLVFAQKNTRKPIIQFYTYTENKTLKNVDLNINYSFCELKREKQNDKWLVANNKNQIIIDKLFLNSNLIGDICDIAKGSESGNNEIFTISKEKAIKYNIEKNILRKCVKNSNVLKYFIEEVDLFLIYSDNYFSENEYPNAYKYLENNKVELLDRRGPKTNEYEWWRLHRPSIKEIFDAEEKLIVPYRANQNRFAYDNNKFFNNGGDVRVLVIKENVPFSIKYLLTLLNSNLLDWFFGFIGKAKGGSREYFNKPLSEIPIKKISLSEQKSFEEKADLMINLNKEYQKSNVQFTNLLQSKFSIEKLTTKLQNWHELEFREFLQELGKSTKTRGLIPLSKFSLSLKEEAEWMQYFNEQKQKAQELKTQISQTDKEIDRMVYELYGLNEEEIRIVEGV